MLLFPHDSIRKTQDKLISDIQASIKRKQHILIHAPTGIGKTAAILSAVLTETLDKNITIFFLTPKHTQHRIVIDTIRSINQKHNSNVQCIDLIGKRWMCAMDSASLLSSSEFHDYCQDMIKKETCDFYSNYKSKSKKTERELLMRELTEKNPLHVEELTSISKTKHFCPYEISTELGKKAKVIIADYHHILNPSIREALLKKTDKLLSSSIIIFDEAHNLLDRSRDLLTNKITTQMLDIAIREA
ncbi:MAG TPA: DEAD/DEAH box helicase, partial [Candidatus Nanoarchaeia archaeon]|nr:DEAD/DEAH box helicase [Candidatus Nanoarchaeia archaeon]